MIPMLRTIPEVMVSNGTKIFFINSEFRNLWCITKILVLSLPGKKKPKKNQGTCFRLCSFLNDETKSRNNGHLFNNNLIQPPPFFVTTKQI